MKKTLFIVLDDADERLLDDYIRSHGNEEILVAAPRSLNEEAGRSHGVTCVSLGEEAWEMDYARVRDHARRCAFGWYSLPSVERILDECGLGSADAHAIIAVSQGNLYLHLLEVFQSYEYCKRLIERVHPDKLVVSAPVDLYGTPTTRPTGMRSGAERAQVDCRGQRIGDPRHDCSTFERGTTIELSPRVQ